MKKILPETLIYHFIAFCLKAPHTLDLLDTELEILMVLFYLHLQNHMIIDAKLYANLH